MHIQKVAVENIRNLRHVELEFPRGAENGWHVIVGDNGSGKSSLIRSIALALVGPSEAIALRQDWAQWITSGQSVASVQLQCNYEPSVDRFSGPGPRGKGKTVSLGVQLIGSDRGVAVEKLKTKKLGADRTIWGAGSGWFSAAYGPFRRFTGGDRDYDRLFFSNPRLAAHLTAFGEDVALTECIEWLKALQFRKLETDQEAEQLLESIIDFVNQADFLPHGVRLESISSSGVDFVDADEHRIPIEDLSDGYRSVLSMTLELIRQLDRAYSSEVIFAKGDMITVSVPGVVLIDEVDAHLHPTWQRRIGEWFTRHFPNIQFIVTTHSPIVCRAAVSGTLWKLVAPGYKDSEEPNIREVTGIGRERLIYGNVLEAYGTDLFGVDVTRSDASRKLLAQLAILNRKELLAGLTEEEVAEQERLRSVFPTTATRTELSDASVA